METKQKSKIFGLPFTLTSRGSPVNRLSVTVFAGENSQDIGDLSRRQYTYVPGTIGGLYCDQSINNEKQTLLKNTDVFVLGTHQVPEPSNSESGQANNLVGPGGNNIIKMLEMNGKSVPSINELLRPLDVEVTFNAVATPMANNPGTYINSGNKKLKQRNLYFNRMDPNQYVDVTATTHKSDVGSDFIIQNSDTKNTISSLDYIPFPGTEMPGSDAVIGSKIAAMLAGQEVDCTLLFYVYKRMCIFNDIMGKVPDCAANLKPDYDGFDPGNIRFYQPEDITFSKTFVQTLGLDHDGTSTTISIPAGQELLYSQLIRTLFFRDCPWVITDPSGTFKTFLDILSTNNSNVLSRINIVTNDLFTVRANLESFDVYSLTNNETLSQVISLACKLMPHRFSSHHADSLIGSLLQIRQSYEYGEVSNINFPLQVLPSHMGCLSLVHPQTYGMNTPFSSYQTVISLNLTYCMKVESVVSTMCTYVRKNGLSNDHYKDKTKVKDATTIYNSNRTELWSGKYSADSMMSSLTGCSFNYVNAIFLGSMNRKMFDRYNSTNFLELVDDQVLNNIISPNYLGWFGNTPTIWNRFGKVLGKTITITTSTISNKLLTSDPAMLDIIINFYYRTLPLISGYRNLTDAQYLNAMLSTNGTFKSSEMDNILKISSNWEKTNATINIEAVKVRYYDRISTSRRGTTTSTDLSIIQKPSFASKYTKAGVGESSEYIKKIDISLLIGRVVGIPGLQTIVDNFGQLKLRDLPGKGKIARVDIVPRDNRRNAFLVNITHQGLELVEREGIRDVILSGLGTSAINFVQLPPLGQGEIFGGGRIRGLRADDSLDPNFDDGVEDYDTFEEKVKSLSASKIDGVTKDNNVEEVFSKIENKNNKALKELTDKDKLLAVKPERQKVEVTENQSKLKLELDEFSDIKELYQDKGYSLKENKGECVSLLVNTFIDSVGTYGLAMFEERIQGVCGFDTLFAMSLKTFRGSEKKVKKHEQNVRLLKSYYNINNEMNFSRFAMIASECGLTFNLFTMNQKGNVLNNVARFGNTGQQHFVILDRSSKHIGLISDLFKVILYNKISSVYFDESLDFIKYDHNKVEFINATLITSTRKKIPIKTAFGMVIKQIKVNRNDKFEG